MINPPGMEDRVTKKSKPATGAATLPSFSAKGSISFTGVDGLLVGHWTLKQRLFVHEYFVDFKPADAAIRAGYSENGAAQTAYRTMQLPHVAVEIERLLQERLRKIDITADRVLNQIGNIAFADLRKLSPELMNHLDAETAAAIQSVKLSKKQSGEYDEDGNPIWDDVVEYRTADKNGALNMLGKALKLLNDRVTHDGAVDVSATVKVVEIPAKAALPDDDGNVVKTEAETIPEEQE